MIKILDELVDQSIFKSFHAIEVDTCIRINSFYIHIKERNQGLGSREIQKIIDYADEVGKDIILYATSSKNKRFYRRNGFKNSPEDYIYSCNMRRVFVNKPLFKKSDGDKKL